MFSSPKSGNILHWLQWGAQELENTLDNNNQESEWLMSSLLNCKRSEIIGSEKLVTHEQTETFKKWIQRRKNGEPSQYISGWTEFYGRRFNVSTSVLIPRQETERLVDVAIHTLNDNKSMNIVDIGTGSGCIAISLAAELKNTFITGVDISASALTIAEENAALNSVDNIEFLQLDFLNQIPIEPKYDALVMNPPYIPHLEMDRLMGEVKFNEPDLALTDHNNGLTFYQHLAIVAKNWVKPKGWLIMEVGIGDHPQKAKSCFSNDSFIEHELLTDLNSDDRILQMRVV